VTLAIRNVPFSATKNTAVGQTRNPGTMSTGNQIVSIGLSSNLKRPHTTLHQMLLTILMPVGTFFQTAPSSDIATTATAPTPSASGSNNAATQLSEAIDEFLADVESKFKVMNDEVMTKCS
jgi:hypothetical protein